MAIHFDYGDEVRVQTTFSDVDGLATDPNAVFFKFKDPSGNITTYTYGVDSELIKSATGVYYVDLDLDESGGWRWR